MYAKGKGSSVPSDSQAREKYVCYTVARESEGWEIVKILRRPLIARQLHFSRASSLPLFRVSPLPLLLVRAVLTPLAPFPFSCHFYRALSLSLSFFYRHRFFLLEGSAHTSSRNLVRRVNPVYRCDELPICPSVSPLSTSSRSNVTMLPALSPLEIGSSLDVRKADRLRDKSARAIAR